MRCMQNFAIPTQIMNESAQCICTESLSNPVPPMFPPTHTCATTLFELKTKTKSSHQRRVRSASRQWTWSDKKVPISVIGIRSATHFPPFSFFSQCCYAHHSFSLGAWRNPARALRALGLLLADGTPTGGRGEDFLSRQPNFFTETAVTPERKVEKSFPRWEINRHVEG